jgi:predicted dinucleotide-binding enzyme
LGYEFNRDTSFSGMFIALITTIQGGKKMKIGIIGAGHIGGALAHLWARSGHQVVISSRHVDKLDPLIRDIGPNSCKGTILEAARFGEVVVLAIPLKGIKDTGAQIANFLSNKVVIDTMNPFIERDGLVAKEILNRGISSGEATQERFPTAKIVRAFNSIYFNDLLAQAHRGAPLVAIPFSSDSSDAIEVCKQLITDAGFVFYELGPLNHSKAQDPGGILFGKALTVKQIEDLQL